MAENPYSIDAQLARIRTMPQAVLWLTQTVGCWVLGSQAGFSDVRVHARSDWDILVPFELWEQVSGAIPADARKNKAGGWRFDASFVDGRTVVVDVFPGSLDAFLRKPYCRVAWHPKTATIVEVMNPAVAREEAPNESSASNLNFQLGGEKDQKYLTPGTSRVT